MHLKIDTLFEGREEYEDIVRAYDGYDITITNNGTNRATIEADGTLKELVELSGIVPYGLVGSILIKGGEQCVKKEAKIL